MKGKDWYELHGWMWDKRDHMWKKQINGGKETLHETLEMKGPREANLGIKVIEGKNCSKPFTKKYNTFIFNNIQYPLKFHEVMFKK